MKNIKGKVPKIIRINACGYVKDKTEGATIEMSNPKWIEIYRGNILIYRKKFKGVLNANN